MTELFDELVHDTLEVSIPHFRPELCLCVVIVAVLLIRLFDTRDRIDSFYIAVIGAAIAFWLALPRDGLGQIGQEPRHEIFTGLLVYDSVTVYFRLLLTLFAVLLMVLTKLTRVVSAEDTPDFYCLVLGATLGMCIMASANHLLSVFLGVEMASVPSYVLAGILRGQRRSSEASLKYAVYGAGAAGVMLYGISLICGVVGSAHLPTIAMRLSEMDIAVRIAEGGAGYEKIMVLALGGLMMMVGLAFKLSAVPFHFWCPDVFEGASAEVNAFLSVASKAAALALLVRVAIGFSHVPTPTAGLDDQAPSSLLSVADPETDADPHEGSEAEVASPSALAPVRQFSVQLIALLAAVTCTFGNLAAYAQTNIKRLLAYSTIAHAGYMMMPVAAALVALDSNHGSVKEPVGALIFYTAVYLFMNLGAFSIVAFLRGALKSEQIEDYRGLIRSCPITTICFSVILFSLVGLPPLAGFAGKFAIFAALVNAGGGIMMTLVVIGGINTAISLVYYLRVVKVMTIDPEPEDRGRVVIARIPATYIIAVSLPVLILGIFFSELVDVAQQASQNLL